MNITEFKKQAAIKEFNTNNAWGFGGVSGIKYKIGIYSYFEGKYCYRHSPPTKTEYFEIKEEWASEEKFLEAIKTLWQ